MSDTWVFLIREADWDSDAFLPENLAGQDRTELSEEMAAHAAFAQAVQEMGATMVGGEALANRSYGGNVEPAGPDGEPVYTDAALTDSTEVITGFYLVRCDEATARTLAAKVPTGNYVEWRKVHDFE